MLHPTVSKMVLDTKEQELRHKLALYNLAHIEILGLERPALILRSTARAYRFISGERHALTSYPCRLPNGKEGRTAIVYKGGEWVAVCRTA